MTESDTAADIDDPLAREENLPIPRQRLEDAEQRLVAERRKTAVLPGFRRGKVPDSVVRARLGDDLSKQALDIVVQEMMREFAERVSGSQLLGEPRMEVHSKDDGGSDLEMRIQYDLMPELPVVDLTSVVVERIAVDSIEAETEERLRKFCREFPLVGDNDPQHPIELRDRVVLVREAPEGGKSGEAHPVPLRVQSEHASEEMRARLLGRRVGDSIEAPFGEEGVAGTLRIDEVRPFKSEEPSDELATQMRLSDLDELRVRIQTHCEELAGDVERRLLFCRVCTALGERLEFDVPRHRLHETAKMHALQIDPSARRDEGGERDAEDGEEEEAGAAAASVRLTEARLDSTRRIMRLAIWSQGFRQRIGLSAVEADVIRAYMGWQRPASGYASFVGRVAEELGRDPEAASTAFGAAINQLTLDAVLERISVRESTASLAQMQKLVKREEKEFCAAESARLLHEYSDLPTLWPFGTALRQRR